MASPVVCTTSLAVGVVALMAAGTPASSRPVDPVTVELRLGVRSGLDQSSLELAEETAGALLAQAGITAAWRDCRGAGVCTDSLRVVVLVQLLPILKLTDETVCGETVHDARSGVATVLVYMPRNREVTNSIRTGGAGRSNPALATLDVGHLVGLTIAHEVGHALGISHGSSGVMKARPSIDDVIALRGSRLMFRQQEAAKMRVAIAAREAGLMARTGPQP